MSLTRTFCPDSPTHSKHNRIICLSPIAVIAAGHVAARLGQVWLGSWAWVPLTTTFWLSMLVFIQFSGGLRSFICPSSGGTRHSWLWPFLSILIGLAPLPLMILYHDVLRPVEIWLPWLIFALINPFLEEAYWRGALLKATATWPMGLAVVFTSFFFAASHPAMWGVFSSPTVLRKPSSLPLSWALSGL